MPPEPGLPGLNSSEIERNKLPQERKGSILPSNPSFSGHQTFTIRSGWLKKGPDALQSSDGGAGGVFTRDDAIVTLGVGKNMVQSIRHWLLVTRMAEERVSGQGRELAPTPLGLTLFGSPSESGWDPFLEDEATAWLLHWQLAGPGSLAFTWAWTFNLFREYEFSRDDLARAVHTACVPFVAKQPSEETVQRDIECLLHTYVEARSGMQEDNLDSPLAGLGLIRAAFEKTYRFDVGAKPGLPPAVFAYGLADFWLARHAGAITLPIQEIMYGEGSPGSVFKLDEDSVLEHLDTLDRLTSGYRKLARMSWQSPSLRIVRTGPVCNCLSDCSLHFMPVGYQPLAKH